MASTELRAAAQQALEALEYHVEQTRPIWKTSEAIAALEAALAEPVLEPFGYLWPTGRHPEFRFTQQKRDGVDGMPLYTASPQRVPLTREQAIALWADKSDGPSNGEIVSFARAIERAHGIGDSDE